MRTETMPTMTDRPPRTDLIAGNIPAAMRERDQWVVWRWTWNGKLFKWDKPPLCVATGRKASSTDPETWSTFEAAALAVTSPASSLDGLGFVFSKDDPFVGVDLDKCRAAETGELQPWTDTQRRCKHWTGDAPEPTDIIRRLGSYAEVSPSGLGLHAIVRGKLVKAVKHGSFECYDRGRYFCVTGNRLEGAPTTISEKPEALAVILDEFCDEPNGSNIGSDNVSFSGTNGSTLPFGGSMEVLEENGFFETLLDKARGAGNGAKFRRLFDQGDWQGDGHASQSDGDLALCNLLAFYAGPNPTLIDRLFRGSKLMRDKWEREDYAFDRTIAKALAGRTEFYDWERKAKAGDGSNLWKPEGRTEAANAQRLVDLHAQDIRWCEPWKKWLVWDGARWAIDQQRTIERLARDVARKLWKETAEAGEKNANEKLLAEMVKFSRAASQANGIANMIALARSVPGIPLMPDVFDRNPMVLNVLNGTIDLKTGDLRPHRREDHLTKLAPVEYDPKATAPRWGRFLDEVLEKSDELIEFVKLAAGYSLTGMTTERCLFFFNGRGRNGKTTLVATLQKMLGDYATTITSEMLMSSWGQAHPTEICDLFGARLAVATETEDGRRLAESLVKQLTGGEDRLKGRRMREDFWEFDQTHKLWISGNHRPDVRGTDDGIWDRLRVVPFNVRFENPDKQLAATLEAEMPGILAWALEGCLEWQDGGLTLPRAVLDATGDYRNEQDAIGAFLDQRCIQEAGMMCGASELFHAYKTWCEATGEKALNQTRFGSRLTERGIDRKKTAIGWSRTGVGLIALK